MNSLAAFVLMVGCSADGSVCTEVPAAVPIYESVAECEAALPLALRFASNDQPKLIGTCTAVDRQTLVNAAADVEWSVSKAGVLHVAVTASPNLVASID